jgi:hypothetical protein
MQNRLSNQEKSHLRVPLFLALLLLLLSFAASAGMLTAHRAGRAALRQLLGTSTLPLPPSAVLPAAPRPRRRRRRWLLAPSGPVVWLPALLLAAPAVITLAVS